ncbi:MAG: hypothetical protein HY364_05065 [Candidatus Aenigmarchaeota archaeon]|nr:hypothetical protein [Candidatus Aenigmarchaeota archaeon]
MKGFVRILEALISSIILFTSLTYFFTTYDYSFWNSASLRTLVQDTVSALYIGGTVNESFYSGDPAAVKTALDRIMPSTTDYSAEISGAPPPEIKIHCVCTIAEADIIRTRLGLIGTFFAYNERVISIIMSADPDIGNVDRAADIILFLRTSDLSGQQQRLDNWIIQGRNVMLLADIQQAHFNDETIGPALTDVFGLQWTGSAGGSPGTFTQSDDIRKIPYKIAKYFTASSAYQSSENFNFNPSAGANQISAGEGSVINSGSVSFVKGREAGGRALWFAAYDGEAFILNDDGSVTIRNDDINKLLRAAIIWESGERYVISERDLPSRQPYMRYDFPGAVGSDPYKITILIWKTFY